MGRPKAWMSWSTGKDSALALYEVKQKNEVQVVELLTTVTEIFQRVSIHGVRESLLLHQARELGLPVHIVKIPNPCPNEVYDEHMAAALEEAKSQGVEYVVFGDLFLEDIRKYREKMLEGTGVNPLFPLWGKPTNVLARSMIESGIRAVTTCVDPKQLPSDFVGRIFDESFLAELPDDVDPCGEHGEFHTFVYDCPLFTRPIPIEIGKIVERDGFVFCDVMYLNGEDA